MLHRSFKANKCKTSLKLALSRTKLMKNKKVSQVSQLKRELANLLESGQNQTAGIRVEHVVREEKMVAVYDLLEIYCELIAARLPIIDSQKNCPADVKEAVTSVMFAAPRCTDVPELSDIRKHFVAKYGKEFASSALELRPGCGVGRLLIEKLSVSPLDGQTKLKLLTTVAEDHGIKWDPAAFGDSSLKPADLLNISSGFVKSAVPESDPPLPDPRQATEPVRVIPRPVPEPGFGGGGSGEAWATGFKDVTSAARAAAESAERASFAARAAAELSIRGAHTHQPPPPAPPPEKQEKSEVARDTAVVFDESSSDDDARIEKNPDFSGLRKSDPLEQPSRHLEEPEVDNSTFDGSDSPGSGGGWPDQPAPFGEEFAGVPDRLWRNPVSPPSVQESGEEDGFFSGLNLGELKGGFRNKGHSVLTKFEAPVSRIEISEDDDDDDEDDGTGFPSLFSPYKNRTGGVLPQPAVEGSGVGSGPDFDSGTGLGMDSGGSSRDNKGGHVHPNLPDFDVLSAHLNSLRMSRG